MSENPFQSVFEFQRSAIEQSHKLTVDAVEAQKEAFDVAVETTEQYGDFADQNAEFTKNALHAYLDAVEDALPEGAYDFDEAREFVDESVDESVAAQHEALENVTEVLTESGDAFDDYLDTYVEFVDDSYDSALAAFDQAEENVEEIDVTAA